MNIVEAHWTSVNIVEAHWTSVNIVEAHRTSVNIAEAHRTSVNIVEAHWTSVNIVEAHWTSVNIVEAHWTSVNIVEAHWTSVNIVEDLANLGVLALILLSLGNVAYRPPRLAPRPGQQRPGDERDAQHSDEELARPIISQLDAQRQVDPVQQQRRVVQPAGLEQLGPGPEVDRAFFFPLDRPPYTSQRKVD